MKNFYPKLDKKTGRFLPTPLGQKPPKMKVMEKKLGVRFEKDYKDLYLSRKKGQKLFARRWNSARGLIFSRNLRDPKRRSWIQMLKLPLLNSKGSFIKGFSSKPRCELYDGIDCKAEDCPSLDKAHWVENRKEGSSKSYNILNLCPNCHRKLDRGDRLTIEKARALLLTREVRKLLLLVQRL